MLFRLIDTPRFDIEVSLSWGLWAVGVIYDGHPSYCMLDLYFPLGCVRLAYWHGSLPKPEHDCDECTCDFHEDDIGPPCDQDGWTPQEDEAYCPECGCVLFDDDACSVCNWNNDTP